MILWLGFFIYSILQNETSQDIELVLCIGYCIVFMSVSREYSSIRGRRQDGNMYEITINAFSTEKKKPISKLHLYETSYRACSIIP